MTKYILDKLDILRKALTPSTPLLDMFKERNKNCPRVVMRWGKPRYAKCGRCGNCLQTWLSRKD